jgi:hypothetical protein
MQHIYIFLICEILFRATTISTPEGLQGSRMNGTPVPVAPIPVRRLVIPAFPQTVDWRDQRLRFA